MFRVLNSGRDMFRPGFIKRETAETFALTQARKNPGRTYRVVQEVAVFKVVPVKEKRK